MRKQDLVGYVDPATIDLELAYEMTRGWNFGEPPESFSFESDALPKVIDFDELRKVKPPKGYKIDFRDDRDIRIVTSCFDRSIVLDSTHIFCCIKFSTCYVTTEDGHSVFENPVTKKRWKSGSPFDGFVKLDCDRRVTEEDLKYGQGDWTGFEVGDMIHRWSSSANAIECARRIVELRFRNYGNIEIEDCEEK